MSDSKLNSPIQNALISVSDKKGIKEFASALVKQGVIIYSSGGTFTFLEKNKIPAQKVEDLTQFKEILEGRVKTLHPSVHGSILFKRDEDHHLKTIQKLGMVNLNLVVVNLYPFQKVVKNKKVSLATAIENIDIGGVALLRAAAKNHRWVTVISDINDLKSVIKEITASGNTALSTRERLALKAFRTTSEYDNAIANFLDEYYYQKQNLTLHFERKASLRYGENPHQAANFYIEKPISSNSSTSSKKPFNLAQAKILHGKEMSYNNYLDAERALHCIVDFTQKAAAVIKHGNPCGLATGKELSEALHYAWEGDIVSAFGSIVAVNCRFNLESAKFLNKKFVEVLIAPDYDKEALAYLKTKSKNLRILQVKLSKPNTSKSKTNSDYRVISGGLLVQEKDNLLYNELTSVGFKKNSKLDSGFYQFAFITAKHVKSNAITLSFSHHPGYYMLLGMGAGQPNRIDALKKLAIVKAEENIKRLYPNQKIEQVISKCVMASDAFFPFKDSVEEAHRLGIKKIIQPGGSIRDPEIIQAAKKLKVEMYFTGTRHFLH